jgi:hypothetical protein
VIVRGLSSLTQEQVVGLVVGSHRHQLPRCLALKLLAAPAP